MLRYTYDMDLMLSSPYFDMENILGVPFGSLSNWAQKFLVKMLSEEQPATQRFVL